MFEKVLNGVPRQESWSALC